MGEKKEKWLYKILMNLNQSNVIRKYIKQIKNDDIRDIQRSIYARYISVEDIGEIELKKKKNLIKLQQQSEYKRETFLGEKK